jgi:hypothetical protein
MTTSSYTPNQVQRLASSSVDPDAQVSAPIAPCGYDLDVTKRDRFELLSAYLDGEVTPEERQQVLCWLQTDASARCLYDRLLTLRQGMRSQVCPPSCDAETAVVGVFRDVNRRLQLATMATAGVAAIGVINLLSGGSGAGYAPWRVAIAPQPEALQIALDRPAFPIPESGERGHQSGLPVDSDL